MIALFAIGVVVGCILTRLIFRFQSVGDLRIDTSDPDDGPYMFLELSKDVHTLMRQKYVVLKVNLKNYISHE